MFVVVKHTVMDQERFWGPPGLPNPADQLLADLPEDVILHSTYAKADGSEAICLWEVGSMDKLRNLMEAVTQGISKNEYLAVDPQRSRNLPPTRMARKAA